MVSKLVSGSSDEKSSYKEHRVDALAPYADEGRGKLRKATGSQEGTRGTETSKYPQEEKINNDFLSSGERTGKRPNRGACSPGLWVSDMYVRL